MTDWGADVKAEGIAGPETGVAGDTEGVRRCPDARWRRIVFRVLMWAGKQRRESGYQQGECYVGWEGRGGMDRSV